MSVGARCPKLTDSQTRPHGLRAVVEATYRFEGSTDPDDEAVVFGLSCPSCETRGVLVATYGPSASAEEAAVVAALSSPD